jgi:WD40 repeat protein
MLLGTHEGELQLWSDTFNQESKYELTMKAPIRSIKTSPSDQQVAVCSVDGNIYVFEFFEPERRNILSSGNDEELKTLDWHPQLGLLASGGIDKVIRLWDVRSMSLIRSIQAHTDVVYKVQFNKNGVHYLTCSKDKSIRCFDLRMLGRELCCWKTQYEPLTLDWHPYHENLFAEGTNEGYLRYWLVGERDTVDSVIAHDDAIRCMAWHPLGNLIVTGSSDASTKFWGRGKSTDAIFDRFTPATLLIDEFETFNRQAQFLKMFEKELTTGAYNIPSMLPASMISPTQALASLATAAVHSCLTSLPPVTHHTMIKNATVPSAPSPLASLVSGMSVYSVVGSAPKGRGCNGSLLLANPIGDATPSLALLANLIPGGIVPTALAAVATQPLRLTRAQAKQSHQQTKDQMQVAGMLGSVGVNSGGMMFDTGYGGNGHDDKSRNKRMYLEWYSGDMSAYPHSLSSPLSLYSNKTLPLPALPIKSSSRASLVCQSSSPSFESSVFSSSPSSSFSSPVSVDVSLRCSLQPPKTLIAAPPVSNNIADPFTFYFSLFASGLDDRWANGYRACDYLVNVVPEELYLKKVKSEDEEEDERLERAEEEEGVEEVDEVEMIERSGGEPGRDADVGMDREAGVGGGGMEKIKEENDKWNGGRMEEKKKEEKKRGMEIEDEEDNNEDENSESENEERKKNDILIGEGGSGGGGGGPYGEGGEYSVQELSVLMRNTTNRPFLKRMRKLRKLRSDQRLEAREIQWVRVGMGGGGGGRSDRLSKGKINNDQMYSNKFFFNTDMITSGNAERRSFRQDVWNDVDDYSEVLSNVDLKMGGNEGVTIVRQKHKYGKTGKKFGFGNENEEGKEEWGYVKEREREREGWGYDETQEWGDDDGDDEAEWETNMFPMYNLDMGVANGHLLIHQPLYSPPFSSPPLSSLSSLLSQSCLPSFRSLMYPLNSNLKPLHNTNINLSTTASLLLSSSSSSSSSLSSTSHEKTPTSTLMSSCQIPTSLLTSSLHFIVPGLPRNTMCCCDIDDELRNVRALAAHSLIQTIIK